MDKEVGSKPNGNIHKENFVEMLITGNRKHIPEQHDKT